MKYLNTILVEDELQNRKLMEPMIIALLREMVMMAIAKKPIFMLTDSIQLKKL